MKINLNQKLTALGTVGLTIATWVLPFVPPVSAEVVARAQGRCKLTDENSEYPRFNGHCVVKQKQQGTTTIFVVELDDGSKYRFFGPGKDALQVETDTGLHNVIFNEQADKGVFIWQDNRVRNRLSVKLDSQYPANVSHDDDSKPATGQVLAGAAVGALIVGLLSGGKNSSSTNTASAQVGQPVPNLEDLVGARAGQAENTLSQRGYVWVKATQQADSAYSNWLERRTGKCVAIRTTDGRYAAIVYAPKADCDR